MKNAHSIATLAIVLVFSLLSGPLWAQAPAGFELYLGMKDQFEIALPAGWSVYDQGAVVGAVPGGGPPVVFFSSEVIDGKWA